MSFNRKKGRFSFVFDADAAVEAPTEIYVPSIQYPHGAAVTVTGGRFEKTDESILVYADSPGRCTVEICRIG
jgi:hypothetical protein